LNELLGRVTGTVTRLLIYPLPEIITVTTQNFLSHPMVVSRIISALIAHTPFVAKANLVASENRIAIVLIVAL
jgi:hypothetical protein